MNAAAFEPHSAGAVAFSRLPGIIETDLGDEMILLDPVTQEMFALNAVGRFIWLRLDEAPLAAIVDEVVGAFEVAREAARSDAQVLVGRLLDAGLAVAR